MCNLIKCCANCKYHEHIQEVDNEVDWCHYLNQAGTITKISGRTCGYYEQNN